MSLHSTPVEAGGLGTMGVAFTQGDPLVGDAIDVLPRPRRAPRNGRAS
jgi:hypothetical protein